MSIRPPTPETIRAHFATLVELNGGSGPWAEEQFDRMLIEVQRQAWEAGRSADWGRGYAQAMATNPHETETDR